MTASKRNNWILGVVSGVVVAAITGLFLFVVNVSQSIAGLQAGQNEVNNAIINRLEKIETGFTRYADGQEDRWQSLTAELSERSEGKYSEEDAARDHKIAELQRENSDLLIRLWVKEQLEKQEL